MRRGRRNNMSSKETGRGTGRRGRREERSAERGETTPEMTAPSEILSRSARPVVRDTEWRPHRAPARLPNVPARPALRTAMAITAQRKKVGLIV
ncbi:hypothetical protein AALO_G00286740 [Alosa alosa]|uniref:Uncharacterized protein n=1 Tax=Alosa alosa TaxID=278164 RepID=A0AAV6FFR9_9TELE|nr:hypothetical protein AALO_G00286740 [Alosa alosa]